MDESLLAEIREFADRLRPALALLREGRTLARDAGSSDWQYAVEIADLQATGASKNAIRWLINQGYARHAVETTRPVGPTGRQFEFVDNLVFSSAACLVLSESGARFAIQWQRGPVSLPADASSATDLPPPRGPHWDARRRVLSIDGLVVKHFKVPAGNQQLVLSAFQEEGWPQAIDDPLPPAEGIDAKRRLHDTINRLNRNQKQRLMRFRGNGSGRAVCWARTSDPVD